MGPTKFSVSLFIAAFAAGCSLTPDYFRPDVPVPRTFTTKSTAAAPTIDLEWWRAFRNRNVVTRVRHRSVVHVDDSDADRIGVRFACGCDTQLERERFATGSDSRGCEGWISSRRIKQRHRCASNLHP